MKANAGMLGQLLNTVLWIWEMEGEIELLLLLLLLLLVKYKKKSDFKYIKNNLVFSVFTNAI